MDEKIKYKKGDKVQLINADKNYYNVSKLYDLGIVDSATSKHVYLTKGYAWRLEDVKLVIDKFTQNKKQFKLLNYNHY